MKLLHKKLLGLLFLAVLLLSLGIFVGKIYRADHHQKLNRALIAAIKKNDTDVVVALLAEGADPNARDLPPDTRSTWQRLWDSLHGKRPQPADGPTALYVALAMRSDITFPPENVALVRALLDKKASINVSDEDGDTPLMWAVMSAKYETVRLLLDKGAAINSRTHDGTTALYCAVPQSDPSIVQLLIAKDAQVNITGTDDTSSLASAAFNGRIANLRLLLAKGAKVNVHDANGETPLYGAVMGDHADCVKLLLSRGALVNTRDNEGDTPLSWARRNKDKEIIKMLKQAGAKK